MTSSAGTGGEGAGTTSSAGGGGGNGVGGEGDAGGGDGTGGGAGGSGGGGAPPLTCVDVCEATYVHCGGEPAGEGVCTAYCEGYPEECQDEAIAFYQCFLAQPEGDCSPCEVEQAALDDCAF